MSTLAHTWVHVSGRSAPLHFIDVNLRGAGQVMFQNNPLTGLLFLAGILWGGIASGSMEVTVGCVIGLVTSTSMAMLLGVDEEGLNSGLYGYNGILVGAALGTFIGPSPVLWAYLIFGAALSTIAMLAISEVVKSWGVSALTFPFVAIALILLLATYYFPSMGLSRLPHAAIPQVSPPPAIPLGTGHYFPAVFTGISQVFLVENVLTGVIFLVALGVNSLSAAAFALIGSIVAVEVAAGLGADGALISAGLFGFSPVLTAIAIGTVFYSPTLGVTLFALLATIFTVIMQASLNVLVAPFGIPTLTMPFVLVTWLFLLPRKHFVPVPHREKEGGALSHAI